MKLGDESNLTCSNTWAEASVTDIEPRDEDILDIRISVGRGWTGGRIVLIVGGTCVIVGGT